MKVAIIYNRDLTGVLNTLGKQNKEFYTEKNVLKVAECIERAGHNVRILDGNMFVIKRLQNFMPRTIDGEQMGMVFNMAYGIQGESRYTHIPSLLEMLGVPYVGSSPSGHALALDKVMTKIVWQNMGIPTPAFWVFSSSSSDLSTVKYPVIVKPKMESVSFGLKIVYTEPELRDAIDFVVSEFQQPALVEQFVRGREFCVGLLGNTPTEAFPLLEIDLEGNPDGVQTLDDKQRQPRKKICPAALSPELAGRMVDYSIQAFKSLELRDFARVDIRMDSEDNIYLLEINSMASLGETGSYPVAAKVAGYDFSRLVNKILDVAAVRYFSNSLMSVLPEEKKKKLPVHSRLRAFLRSRQQNTEKILEKITNIDTHVRNIEGVNRCINLIKSELTHLGFSSEIYPQLEVGNMLYFTNSPDREVDFLLLMPLDDVLKMPSHENFSSTEHHLYGTGVWENKGGAACCISALQAMRFAKLIRRVKIGIFVITDSSISGKFSRNLINIKAQSARNIVSLHGGNSEGSIITSRSGSASYSYGMKLIDSSESENVALVAHHFFKTQLGITDMGKNDRTNVIAPYSTEFTSNIFKVNAFGTSNISVRFNSIEDFSVIDSKIRKILKVPKPLKHLLGIQSEGGMTRPPMPVNEENNRFFKHIKKIGTKIDTRVIAEHRWSSADICNINCDIPKIDGMGPVGGYDKNKSEYILRHSMIDRALLLALLMSDPYPGN